MLSKLERLRELREGVGIAKIMVSAYAERMQKLWLDSIVAKQRRIIRKAKVEINWAVTEHHSAQKNHKAQCARLVVLERQHKRLVRDKDVKRLLRLLAQYDKLVETLTETEMQEFMIASDKEERDESTNCERP